MSREIHHGVPPTTEQLRAIIEVEQDVTMWGQPHRVTPRLVSEVFGDGRLLLEIIPLATRPNFYVVRVDSSWGWNEGGRNNDAPIRDHLDEIYDAIEDEYGDTVCDCPDLPAEPDPDCHCTRDFPALRLDSGCSWAPAYWPAKVSQ